MTETEIKIRAANHRGLREKLKHLGFKRAYRMRREATVYYVPVGDNAVAEEFMQKGYLRLRRVDGKTDGYITHKARANYSHLKAARLLVREENETHVEDWRTMHVILNNIGFESHGAYKLNREKWTHKGQNVEVLLDRWGVEPLARYWVEVEGPEFTVGRVIRLLGLTNNKREESSYYDLLRQPER